jgi:Kef-type K+ transport system membrane component KefB
MGIAIIITICTLLLFSYVFDVTSKFTKIPSVILMLCLGWVVNQLASFFQIPIPDLNPLLPILGTIGLILIVLDGSLELELNKSKIPLIKKSLIISLLSMFLFSVLFGLALSYFLNLSFKDCLLNAMPLSIISSAIAIPSARDLSAKEKEFVV